MSEGFRGLRLTNTMTRQKEDFSPLDWRDDQIADADKKVRMYVCGPTVYDYAHIGNARPVIVFDVLFRLLRHLYGEDHVAYVRNITDVDDKINARAARDFPDLSLNAAIAQVTATTTQQFHEDIAALGCLPPTVEPRATDYVTDGENGHDMVSMIEALIAKGHAYETNGEVLFDVTSMADYGALSKRKLEDQQAGARVAVESHKRNPGDFVLWKRSSDGEPGWDSRWGRGRPGWHIECSVMSAAHLGETFDIHGGGLDLIFPHHENEIAQSRCAHGSDAMAEVWMHNGYVQVEGRKMSKSEGNFVTIHDLLHTDKFGGRKWPGEVLRLAMLMTHYREPIDFSVKRLEEAEAKLTKLYRAFEPIWPVSEAKPDAQVVAQLLDDLATGPAFNAASRKAAGGSSAESVDNVSQSGLDFESDPGSVLAAARLMGLLQSTPTEWFSGDEDTTEIDTRVAERLAFIRDKKWADADRIRDELLERGIQLKDSKDPETGERITTWEVKR